MAKKRLPGRPNGPEKRPLNIYIGVDRLAKLRELAKEQQRNISIVVENALQTAYGI